MEFKFYEEIIVMTQELKNMKQVEIEYEDWPAVPTREEAEQIVRSDPRPEWWRIVGVTLGTSEKPIAYLVESKAYIGEGKS